MVRRIRKLISLWDRYTDARTPPDCFSPHPELWVLIAVALSLVPWAVGLIGYLVLRR